MNNKALKISSLKKNYGILEALKGINLEIKQGEFFALLGPNGAGKTTTISIVSGLTNLSSGEVKVFGLDLIKDYKKVRSFIGLSPQEYNFDIFETVENTLLFHAGYHGMRKKEAKKRVDELLEQFDLKEKINEKVVNLSGGMKRRLIIARALMHNPKILILDEPTAGVDVELRKFLWKFLRKLNKQGTTILLTTHYIEEAQELCEKVAIIDHGNLIALGTPDELRNKLPTFYVELTLNKSIKPFTIKDAKLEFKKNRIIAIGLNSGNILNDLIKIVSKNKLKIQDINIKRNTLEDIFIELTKRK